MKPSNKEDSTSWMEEEESFHLDKLFKEEEHQVEKDASDKIEFQEGEPLSPLSEPREFNFNYEVDALKEEIGDLERSLKASNLECENLERKIEELRSELDIKDRELETRVTPELLDKIQHDYESTIRSQEDKIYDLAKENKKLQREAVESEPLKREVVALKEDYKNLRED